MASSPSSSSSSSSSESCSPSCRCNCSDSDISVAPEYQRVPKSRSSKGKKSVAWENESSKSNGSLLSNENYHLPAVDLTGIPTSSDEDDVISDSDESVKVFRWLKTQRRVFVRRIYSDPRSSRSMSNKNYTDKLPTVDLTMTTDDESETEYRPTKRKMYSKSIRRPTLANYGFPTARLPSEHHERTPGPAQKRPRKPENRTDFTASGPYVLWLINPSTENHPDPVPNRSGGAETNVRETFGDANVHRMTNVMTMSNDVTNSRPTYEEPGRTDVRNTSTGPGNRAYPIAGSVIEDGRLPRRGQGPRQKIVEKIIEKTNVYKTILPESPRVVQTISSQTIVQNTSFASLGSNAYPINGSSTNDDSDSHPQRERPGNVEKPHPPIVNITPLTSKTTHMDPDSPYQIVDVRSLSKPRFAEEDLPETQNELNGPDDR